MSTQHHGSLRDERDTLKRFFNESMEATGQPSERKYVNGRLSAEDDGEFAYGVAVDKKRRVVVIRFPHPTEWIGLAADDVERLRDHLTEKLAELRGVSD